MIWHGFLHYIGLDNAQSPWYLFWSGFGGGPLAWCVIPLTYVRHHNCNEPRCLRLGVHPVDGTPFKACRKHHPALPDKATPGYIAKAYKRAHQHEKD